MTLSSTPIPKGYHSVTPYLIVDNAIEAIRFYERVFAATQHMVFQQPNGKIGHAELLIGDSMIMLADEHPERGALSSKAYNGTAMSIHLYVKDVDVVFNRALKEGGKQVMALENMFYGDRCGCIEDPFGFKWHIATQVEVVSEEEIKIRVANLFDKK